MWVAEDGLGLDKDLGKETAGSLVNFSIFYFILLLCVCVCVCVWGGFWRNLGTVFNLEACVHWIVKCVVCRPFWNKSLAVVVR